MEGTEDGGDSMDTLSDAIRQLQAEGYTANLYAGDDRTLRCDEWPEALDPATMQVDAVRRFEGQSDPGDMTILFALTTPTGARGVYSAAFNAETPPEDVAIIEVLRR